MMFNWFKRGAIVLFSFVFRAISSKVYDSNSYLQTTESGLKAVLDLQQDLNILTDEFTNQANGERRILEGYEHLLRDDSLEFGDGWIENHDDDPYSSKSSHRLLASSTYSNGDNKLMMSSFYPSGVFNTNSGALAALGNDSFVFVWHGPLPSDTSTTGVMFAVSNINGTTSDIVEVASATGSILSHVYFDDYGSYTSPWSDTFGNSSTPKVVVFNDASGFAITWGDIDASPYGVSVFYRVYGRDSFPLTPIMRASNDSMDGYEPSIIAFEDSGKQYFAIAWYANVTGVPYRPCVMQVHRIEEGPPYATVQLGDYILLNYNQLHTLISFTDGLGYHAWDLYSTSYNIDLAFDNITRQIRAAISICNPQYHDSNIDPYRILSGPDSYFSSYRLYNGIFCGTNYLYPRLYAALSLGDGLYDTVITKIDISGLLSGISNSSYATAPLLATLPTLSFGAGSNYLPPAYYNHQDTKIALWPNGTYCVVGSVAIGGGVIGLNFDYGGNVYGSIYSSDDTFKCYLWFNGNSMYQSGGRRRGVGGNSPVVITYTSGGVNRGVAAWVSSIPATRIFVARFDDKCSQGIRTDIGGSFVVITNNDLGPIYGLSLAMIGEDILAVSYQSPGLDAAGNSATQATWLATFNISNGFITPVYLPPPSYNAATQQAQMKAQYANLTAQLANFTAQYAAAQATISGLQNSSNALSGTTNATIYSLQGNITALNSTIYALQDTISLLNNNLTRSQVDYSQLQNLFGNVTANLTQLQAAFNELLSSLTPVNGTITDAPIAKALGSMLSALFANYAAIGGSVGQVVYSATGNKNLAGGLSSSVGSMVFNFVMAASFTVLLLPTLLLSRYKLGKQNEVFYSPNGSVVFTLEQYYKAVQGLSLGLWMVIGPLATYLPAASSFSFGDLLDNYGQAFMLGLYLLSLNHVQWFPMKENIKQFMKRFDSAEEKTQAFCKVIWGIVGFLAVSIPTMFFPNVKDSSYGAQYRNAMESNVSYLLFHLIMSSSVVNGAIQKLPELILGPTVRKNTVSLYLNDSGSPHIYALTADRMHRFFKNLLLCVGKLSQANLYFCSSTGAYYLGGKPPIDGQDFYEKIDYYSIEDKRSNSNKNDADGTVQVQSRRIKRDASGPKTQLNENDVVVLSIEQHNGKLKVYVRHNKGQVQVADEVIAVDSKRKLHFLVFPEDISLYTVDKREPKGVKHGSVAVVKDPDGFVRDLQHRASHEKISSINVMIEDRCSFNKQIFAPLPEKKEKRWTLYKEKVSNRLSVINSRWYNKKSKTSHISEENHDTSGSEFISSNVDKESGIILKPNRQGNNTEAKSVIPPQISKELGRSHFSKLFVRAECREGKVKSDSDKWRIYYLRSKGQQNSATMK